MGLNLTSENNPISNATYQNLSYTNELRRAVEIGRNEYARQDDWHHITLKNISVTGVQPLNAPTAFRGNWANGTLYNVGEWVNYLGDPYRVLVTHTSTGNPLSQPTNYILAQPVTNGICIFGKNYLVQDVTINNVAGSTSDCEGYYQKARYSVLERATLFNAGSEQAAVAHKGADPPPNPNHTSNPGGYDNDIIDVSVEFTSAYNTAALALGTPTNGFFAQSSQLRYETIKCKGASGHAVASSIRNHNDLSYKGITVLDHTSDTCVSFRHNGQNLFLNAVGLTTNFVGTSYGIVVEPFESSLTNVVIKNVFGNTSVGVHLKGVLGNVTLDNIALPILVSGTVETLTLSNCPTPTITGSVGTLVNNGVVYPAFPNSSLSSLSRKKTRLAKSNRRVSLGR